MEIKWTLKHKDNVVYLFGDDVLWFVDGFKELAERVETPIDVVFMLVMELSVSGLIEPVPLEETEGELRLKFKVARNLREAKELRRSFFERGQLTPERFENLSLLREGLLGPIPEELRR